jgi:KaiC/GvpD/RAD55 family RecA-like ATPase
MADIEVENIKISKALSSKDLLSKKYKLFKFKNEWYDAFGQPETTGVWFIWGNSGNGKTRFVLQLIKELARFDKVLYNSLEEGAAHTMQKAWQDNQMESCGKNLQLVSEGIDVLKERLNKRQSPRVVVLDSFQYTQLNFKEYMKLKTSYPQKLFVFTSQSDSRSPSGKTAIKVMYDASLKIWVEGYKAFSKGRYIGHNGGIYTIWDEGSKSYWGTTE